MQDRLNEMKVQMNALKDDYEALEGKDLEMENRI